MVAGRRSPDAGAAQSGRRTWGASRSTCSIPTSAENAPEDRAITDQLYGGDQDMRIQQEIVLGIGGYRALAALGLEPSVYHMNEGHSAFLALERMRR